MHKLSSSGVLRDGVARLQAPGGADVRVEMSHPPQNRHAACMPPAAHPHAGVIVDCV